MHVHLPKPLHGWRAFAGEVAIIVLGVLIALLAEQAVENLRWRDEQSAGREALRLDLKDVLTNAIERQKEDMCVRERLLYLRSLLDRRSGSLPALGHFGSPPARAWYPTSWDTLVASNVSAHFKRDDLLAFGVIAQGARRAEDETKAEIDDWSVIYTMSGPARSLASGEEAQLRRAITGAAFHLNTIRLIAPQLARAILATNLLTREDRAEVDTNISQLMAGPNARHICGRIMAPDPARVDAPYDPAVQIDPLHRTEGS